MTVGARKLGLETRERILEVALELFALQGYGATSIRDISEHLGMTKASLYYHFTSKEEILEAITSPFSDDLEELSQRAGRLEPFELLSELVALICRRGSVMRVVVSDPSGIGSRHKADAMRFMRRLVEVLGGEDDPAGRLRARCALGAVQGGIFGTIAAEAGHTASAGHPASGGPGTGTGMHLPGPLLDERDQAAIVAAALRALGPATG
jgi:AcrR family transcriptional regulator